MKKTTIRPTRKFVKWEKPKNKVYFTTLAAIFKTYNDDLQRADALFEVFSPERLEAQATATDRLRKRLKDLNLDRLLLNLDFEGSYRNVIRYASIRYPEKAA